MLEEVSGSERSCSFGVGGLWRSGCVVATGSRLFDSCKTHNIVVYMSVNLRVRLKI